MKDVNGTKKGHKARLGARGREERWGKAARRGAVKAEHERRRWEREERTPQDGPPGKGNGTHISENLITFSPAPPSPMT